MLQNVANSPQVVATSSILVIIYEILVGIIVTKYCNFFGYEDFWFKLWRIFLLWAQFNLGPDGSLVKRIFLQCEIDIFPFTFITKIVIYE